MSSRISVEMTAKFQFVGENNISVARLTTAAIVQRRGYAAVCRRIPRLCAKEGKPIERGWFSSSLRRGIVRLRVLYPRLVTIAAVVSRATKVTSRLRRDKLQFPNFTVKTRLFAVAALHKCNMLATCNLQLATQKIKIPPHIKIFKKTLDLFQLYAIMLLYLC